MAPSEAAFFCVKHSSSQQLYIHEWLAVIVLSSVLLSLALVAYIHRDTTHLPPIPEEAFIPEIEVQVVGELTNPGTFVVKKGITFQELLSQLVLSKDADLSDLKMDAPLRRGQKIKISSLNLKITVEGAVVYPGVVLVKKGTRVNELKSLLEIAEGADLTFFKSRRKLKDGEHLLVPRK